MQGLGPKLLDVNQIILNEEEEGDLSPAAEKHKGTANKPIQWQQVKNNNFGAADAIKKSNLLTRHHYNQQ